MTASPFLRSKNEHRFSLDVKLMRLKYARYVVLAIVGGSLLPVQLALNTRLATTVHSTSAAATVSYGVGSLALLLLLSTRRFEKPDLKRARRAPWWSFLAGCGGAWYIVSSIYYAAVLGVTLTTSLVISGQVLIGFILDHFGWLGVTKRPFNARRLLVLMFMVLAIVCLGVQR
jgi:Uncharacterized protein conserved in bacteria